MKLRLRPRNGHDSPHEQAAAAPDHGFTPERHVLGACGLHESEVVDFHSRLTDLTARETEVLSAILAGYTTVSISFWFGISPKTVNVHRANIYKKLGVKGTGNLIRLAIASGVQPLAAVGGSR